MNEELKDLIQALFIKHTDGKVPSDLEDLFNYDLYSEVSLDILAEILEAAGFGKED